MNQPSKPLPPVERDLWLKLRGAPPDWRIITVDEATQMQLAIEHDARKLMALDAEMKAAIGQLDSFGYWTSEPDLKNACASAAFDARRYERATSAAIMTLEGTEKFLALLATHSQTPVHMIDIATEAAAVASTLKFLRAQSEARRERIT